MNTLRRYVLFAAALAMACGQGDDALADKGPVDEARPASLPAIEEPAGGDVETPEPDTPTPVALQPTIRPHQPLENPEALASFYASLAKLETNDGPGLVRVVHLGASMIGADDLPGVLREKFQRRFGDGGAGLVLLQRYMPNYLHQWVKLNAHGWKHCYIALLCKRDGHYGLGGATFWSSGDASTTISTRRHELGDEVSRFELWYVAHPRGSQISLRVDREEPALIATRAGTLEDRYHVIDVEPSAHSIKIQPKGRGFARAYGVVLETDGPGIVWDQFSMLGAFTKRLLALDAAHVQGQIARRDPDLIVFTYGGNDLRRVAAGKLTKDQYVDEYTRVVRHVRAGKPEASCLITSITDRGKSAQFVLKTAHVELIVTAQREVAKATGCAFFDTYTAMGGAGSLKRWMRERPPLAARDRKHLNHRGRVRLGGWMFDAIMAGYAGSRTDA